MFTLEQMVWLIGIILEYQAAQIDNQLDAYFLTMVARWFACFPIEEEDNDDFFEGQPQIIDQMKRLTVEVSSLQAVSIFLAEYSIENSLVYAVGCLSDASLIGDLASQ